MTSLTTTAPESLLVRYIKAHVRKGDQAKDKADQHYIAAGRYLITLKVSYAPSWAAWEDLLRIKVGLSTGRASELMQIADGRKSPQEIRDGKAQSVARLRAQGSSLRSEEKSAGSTVVSIAPHDLPCVRDIAGSVIDDLIDEGIRVTVIKLVLEGERQSSFDNFRNAVAELYQALSRAGR